jgi:hypothetical protein
MAITHAVTANRESQRIMKTGNGCDGFELDEAAEIWDSEMSTIRRTEYTVIEVDFLENLPK